MYATTFTTTNRRHHRKLLMEISLFWWVVNWVELNWIEYAARTEPDGSRVLEAYKRVVTTSCILEIWVPCDNKLELGLKGSKGSRLDWKARASVVISRAGSSPTPKLVSSRLVPRRSPDWPRLYLACLLTWEHWAAATTVPTSANTYLTTLLLPYLLPLPEYVCSHSSHYTNPQWKSAPIYIPIRYTMIFSAVPLTFNLACGLFPYVGDLPLTAYRLYKCLGPDCVIRGNLLDLEAKAVCIIDSSFAVCTPMTFHSLIGPPMMRSGSKQYRHKISGLSCSPQLLYWFSKISMGRVPAHSLYGGIEKKEKWDMHIRFPSYTYSTY